MEIAELIFYILEMVGTMAFAISGAMVAIERRLDLFGVLMLGITTALGGGILRDVLIGNLPPRVFENHEYVLLAVASSLAVFLIAYLFRDRYVRRQRTIDNINNLFDALGLGAFTVTGVRIAIEAGYGDNAFLAIFLGMMTGIGGGLLRDMMSREIPLVLQKRVYAVASIIGGCVYYWCYLLDLAGSLAIFLSVLTTCIIRIVATVYRWNLPRVFKD